MLLVLLYIQAAVKIGNFYLKILACLPNFTVNSRGVGTGPAGPTPAGPKFPLSIKIETHNSKKF